MKLSKKLVVTTLSSAMALSFVAALSGTIAWYQYNTRVSTTLLGTSVGNAGTLQIRKAGNVNPWGRDLVTADLIGNDPIELTPVTFGALNADGSLPGAAYKDGHADKVWDIAENQRDAFDPDGYNAYEAAVVNKDYIQYSVELKAVSVSNGVVANVAKDVYLSDITLANVGSGEIADALRFHLAIDDDGDGNDDRFLLIANHEVQDLALNGALDFDGNGVADKKGGAEWVANRDKVTFYGRDGEVQNAEDKANWIASKDGDGNIEDSEANHYKKLLSTLAGDSNFVKVTVTLWIEGWDNSLPQFQEDISIDKILYREVKLDEVSNVNGLFTKNASDVYSPAGDVDAADGVTYYEVEEKDLELTAYEDAVPAGSYTKDAGVYTPTVHTVAQPATTYYKLYVREATEVVAPEDIAAKLTGLYEVDEQGNYIVTDDTEVEEPDPVGHPGVLKKYYAKLNSGTDASYYDAIADNEAEFVDVAGDPIPDGGFTFGSSPKFDGYFVKDAQGNFLKASGAYDISETYYVLNVENIGDIENVPMWSGLNTDNATFKFGLVFDVGRDAFAK